ELYFGVKTTNYVTDALSGSYAGIEIKTNTNFVDSQVVYNQDNNSGNPSMFVRGTMTTSNESISPVIDTGRMSVIGVCNRINNDDTDETEPSNGLSLAKYITKKISLATPANSARVYMTIARPYSSEVKVYIKSLPAESSDNFDDQDYVLLD